jgi:hypothetical protein
LIGPMDVRTRRSAGWPSASITYRQLRRSGDAPPRP